jgi:phospholipase C
MTQIDRRRLLALGAASMALPASIQKAWAIDARSPTGTIEDVKHIVVLMQENRSFDHYFGTMNGVRGFGDRFPIPLAGGSTVWRQTYTKGAVRAEHGHQSRADARRRHATQLAGRTVCLGQWPHDQLAGSQAPACHGLLPA